MEIIVVIKMVVIILNFIVAFLNFVTYVETGDNRDFFGTIAWVAASIAWCAGLYYDIYGA